MSILQLFPLAKDAEHQKVPRAILYTHNIQQMVYASAGIAVVGTGAHLFYRKLRPPLNPSNSVILQLPLSRSLVNASFKGMVIGPAIGVIITALEMHKKSWKEWQDRSWWLLALHAKDSTDKWSLGGLIIGGALGTALSRRLEISRPKAVLGSAGVGCVAGLSCMVIYHFLGNLK